MKHCGMQPGNFAFHIKMAISKCYTVPVVELSEMHAYEPRVIVLYLGRRTCKVQLGYSLDVWKQESSQYLDYGTSCLGTFAAYPITGVWIIQPRSRSHHKVLFRDINPRAMPYVSPPPPPPPPFPRHVDQVNGRG